MTKVQRTKSQQTSIARALQKAWRQFQVAKREYDAAIDKPLREYEITTSAGWRTYSRVGTEAAWQRYLAEIDMVWCRLEAAKSAAQDKYKLMLAALEKAYEIAKNFNKEKNNA
jgi:hypothetical protein